MAEADGMNAEVFERIYRENLWNGTESLSGPGSGDAATRTVADAIVALVTDLRIRSVLDVGCGDGYWMPDLPGYVGLDVSHRAIHVARRRHPDRYYAVDRGGGWPMVDLVIMRDVMQHVSLKDGYRMLRHACNVGRYVLASTYVGGRNVDITPGIDAYSPDLMAAPFDMPQPDRLIFDGHYYHEHDTEQVRDRRKFLGLWSVNSNVAS
jgi:SAM-dependent methyltransferase